MKIVHSKQGTKMFIGTLTLAAVMILLIAGNIEAQAGSGYSTTSINVTEFSFTPSTIDSTNGSQTVTITIRVTDSERDIWLLSVLFRSPVIGHQLGFESADRISGNARDAVYRRTFTFNQYSDVGTWVVDYGQVYDGTQAYYRWRKLDTSYLAARGFATQLQVINNNEAVPPEISEFNFTPTSIGVSRNVAVTLRAKDIASGVSSLGGSFSYPPDCYVYDDDCLTIGFGITAADRISGNDKDGVYRVNLDVSLDLPPGTYSASLWAVDGVRNITRLRSWDLSARGYPTLLQLAAAPFVGITGRVMTPNGNGLRNSTVTLTDNEGVVRTATTSSFGFYSFDHVATGSSYTLAVSSRRYRYAPLSLQVNSGLTNLDFMGLE